MDARELARWMREEHDIVEELSAKLREKMVASNRGPRREWLSEVRDSFERFREHFCRHITLEEDDGYLQAVLDRQPTTSQEVERLKHEHEQLIRVIQSISGCLMELSKDDDLLISDCCVRVQNMLAAIDRHEQDENLIVSLVFTHDIGSKD